jgi:hypothetical protein
MPIERSEDQRLEMRNEDEDMAQIRRASVERANRKVWILASPEVLEAMEKDWSPPVQARVTENLDGTWDMTFRAVYNEMGEQIAQPKAG